MKRYIIAAVLAITGGNAEADSPQVEGVKAVHTASGWRFDVTLRHADTGWDHYADGWGVFTEKGKELGYRILAHPHVNEQPFTRSLSAVQIPGTVKQVAIIPHDSVHGTGPKYLFILE